MITEMDRVSLSVFMWTSLEEAVGDLPPSPASELFERFLAWTGRPFAQRPEIPQKAPDVP